MGMAQEQAPAPTKTNADTNVFANDMSREYEYRKGSMDTSREDGAHRIRLQGSLGLRDARRVHELLKDAVGAFNAVEIDVSELNDVDISIIQLIASALKSAERHERTVTLSGSSAGAFAAALMRAGLVGDDGTSRSADEAFWAGRPPAVRKAS
jgi:ABC-type transporter Mla MlaB component